MSCAYFVSDLHLSSADDPKAVRFANFLADISAANGITHLFLLGDIFDMWLADHRYFIDRYRRIVAELVRIKSEGVAVHYFEGNHDLHLRKFWGEQLGFAVHGGPLNTDIAGVRLRLEHGDQMDTDDRGYRFLRWFLRTPVLTFVIETLPGTIAAWIGERASASSRKYTTERKTISSEDAVAKIRAHAARVHEREPFDLLIAGHVHIRDDYTDPRGFRAVNLGTWLTRPCYFALDGKRGPAHRPERADRCQCGTMTARKRPNPDPTHEHNSYRRDRRRSSRPLARR